MRGSWHGTRSRRAGGLRDDVARLWMRDAVAENRGQSLHEMSRSRLRARVSCHLVQAGGCCRAVGTMESSMSKAGLDDRHRNKDGEISHKHGNTLIGTLRKVYGQGFAAGYPEAEKLSEVLLQLNQTSLSQLPRDRETRHLEHNTAHVSTTHPDL